MGISNSLTFRLCVAVALPHGERNMQVYMFSASKETGLIVTSAFSVVAPLMVTAKETTETPNVDLFGILVPFTVSSKLCWGGNANS